MRILLACGGGLLDFSSTVRRASKQKEFEASKEDLKSLQETPLQRFQRLQSEVRELSEELSAAAEVRTLHPRILVVVRSSC